MPTDRNLESLLDLQAALAESSEVALLVLGSPPEGSLEALSAAPGGRTITHLGDGQELPDASVISANLCLVAERGRPRAALAAARFCCAVLRGHGVIVFCERTTISSAISRFLAELPACRVLPLAHDLLVVELGDPTVLDYAAVQARVPRPVWLALDRLRAVPLALRIAPALRRLEIGLLRAFLRATGPPRRGGTNPWAVQAPNNEIPFAIHTFVTDSELYAQMRASFIAAGFAPDAFLALDDRHDDPYGAITRLGRSIGVRYPILCHQDLLADRSADARELVRVLVELDDIDPGWVVAGNAGMTRCGQRVLQLVDPISSPSPANLPASVVSLDENFLVFNRRNAPRCTENLSGFHLYGADVCLHALAAGGSAYVIDFPLTHLSAGRKNADYYQARDRFVQAWSPRFVFRYVVTTTGALFLSRFKALRRSFGSERALRYVDRANRNDGPWLTHFRR